MPFIPIHSRLQRDGPDPYIHDKKEKIPDEHFHSQSGLGRYYSSTFFKIYFHGRYPPQLIHIVFQI